MVEEDTAGPHPPTARYLPLEVSQMTEDGEAWTEVMLGEYRRVDAAS